MPKLKFTENSLGLLIPGQASQAKGMGVEAWEANDHAKRIFYTGSEIVGLDLLQYCSETETEDMTGSIVQPALGAAHLAAIELARSRGMVEDFVLGQSVSEIIALTAEGALSIEDMFKILKVRGEAMEEAFQNNPSIMSAVIGPVREHVDLFIEASQRRLQRLGLPGVYGSMYNSYRQHVVSAHPDAMKVFRDLVEYINSFPEAAKKLLGVELHRTDIKDIKNDGGSHSLYMSEGVQRVYEAIEAVPKSRPRKPVIANNGQFLFRPGTYAPYLAGQLEYPAEWYGSIWVAVDHGARQFVEIEGGNGRILSKNLRHDFPSNSIVKTEFGRVVHIHDIPEEHRPKLSKIAA